jgi:hypothetical protein
MREGDMKTFFLTPHIKKKVVDGLQVVLYNSLHTANKING